MCRHLRSGDNTPSIIHFGIFFFFFFFKETFFFAYYLFLVTLLQQEAHSFPSRDWCSIYPDFATPHLTYFFFLFSWSWVKNLPFIAVEDFTNEPHIRVELASLTPPHLAFQRRQIYGRTCLLISMMNSQKGRGTFT